MQVDDDLYRELESYARRLMSGLRWRVGDRELEPRDLVHEAIARHLEAEARGTRVLDSPAFLTRTMRNAFLDLARACLRRGVRAVAAGEEIGEPEAPLHAGPESTASLAELRAELARTVSSLPERQREVMRLFIDGSSIGAIAQRLGISEVAVRQSLFKARGRLKRAMRGSAV